MCEVGSWIRRGVLHTPKNEFVANAVGAGLRTRPKIFPHSISIKQRKGLKMAEKKDLKQEKLHSIYLFYGKETYLLENAVKKNKEEFWRTNIRN